MLNMNVPALAGMAFLATLSISCTQNVKCTCESNPLEGLIFYMDAPLQSACLTLKDAEADAALKAEALKHIEDGANAGDPACQYALGNLYADQDDFVADDCVKAAYLWNEAAQKGFTKAFGKIGVAYLEGNGVEKDIKLAVEWIAKGAKAGDNVAQYYYGIMCRDGVTDGSDVLVEVDPKQAEQWWQRSGGQGNTASKAILQQLYNYLEQRS